MASTSSAGGPFPSAASSGEELIFKRPVVVEKLGWRRSMCAEEFVYLRGRATRAIKVTLVSTQQAAAYYNPKSRGAYPTRDAYLADVVGLHSRARSTSWRAWAAPTSRSTRPSTPPSWTPRFARAIASGAVIPIG